MKNIKTKILKKIKEKEMELKKLMDIGGKQITVSLQMTIADEIETLKELIK